MSKLPLLLECQGKACQGSTAEMAAGNRLARMRRQSEKVMGCLSSRVCLVWLIMIGSDLLAVRIHHLADLPNDLSHILALRHSA